MTICDCRYPAWQSFEWTTVRGAPGIEPNFCNGQENVLRRIVHGRHDRDKMTGRLKSAGADCTFKLLLESRVQPLPQTVDHVIEIYTYDG